MSQESRESNADLFDWGDQSGIPLEWGDVPEINLDPQIDSHYWGFWQDVSVDTDTDPLGSKDPPESLRIASEHCVQEKIRQVDESRLSDMSSKLQVAETRIQELQAMLKEARDMVKEKDVKCADLECKLQYMEKKNEGLAENFNEVLKKNTQLLLDQEQQGTKCADLESKLQEMEGKNESLQEKLDLALGKKETILQEKRALKMKHSEVKSRLEDTDKRHKVVEVKLEDMRKQNKTLYGLLHQAQQSNAEVLKQMEAKQRAILQKMDEKHAKMQYKLNGSEEKYAQALKEKEELSKAQRQLQDCLQDSEKRNGDLTEKNKKLQQYKEELENICAEKMCAGIEVMMSKNAELEELHNNAQYKTKQQEKMLKDMQEAKKFLDKKYKELNESHAEKKEKIAELNIRCKKLEEEKEECVSNLHNIILQHKDLHERCLKKKKRFKFFRRNSAAS